MLTDDERRELLAVRDIVKRRIAELIALYGSAVHEECAKTIHDLERRLDYISKQLRDDTIQRALSDGS